MYKLIYSVDAENDLDGIFAYIASDNRVRAVSYLREIEKTINLLKDFPDSGHDPKYPEIKALGIKIAVHGNYLVFYIPNSTDKTIEIVRVLNGAQNYKSML